MSGREWQVGIVGTFDVENYGDLLFPLIAEAELTERLGPVKLHRFSYHAKVPPAWPYLVTPLEELPRVIATLDGLLVGGGFLIRFDKTVAPGYQPPTTEIHHPTGYWLAPALIALQHGVPVVWNAPGMHCNEIPAWADPLLCLAFALSSYIAVRDEPTQAALARFTAAGQIEVVPDSGFGVCRLLEEPPSRELVSLREAAGLTGPYIVVQAALGLAGFVDFFKMHVERFRDVRLLALPIGPVLGDDPAILATELPQVARLPSWPQPLLLAELIRHAEAVVGHSYHLAITALTSGVPAFITQDLAKGKYTALAGFDIIFQLPDCGESDSDLFFARLGRVALSTAVRAKLDLLTKHWDRVAEVLRAGRIDRRPALDLFWQQLPGFLEGLAAARSPEERTIGRNMINLDEIFRQKLETEPYRWAVIGGLFSPQDAADLAVTYPGDHFKLVSARGGEKDYSYEARSLIHMGARTVSYPAELSAAWRSLGQDLLSPDYRSAMSRLTQCDLTDALLEVNVFHYGPGAMLGPHPDLADKIVTHVLYFNRSWSKEEGGCLSILSSPDPADVVEEVTPIVGNSAVIVRSDNSWHAVSPVARHGQTSRRSVTVTFYHPGASSSMWPPEDTAPLHRHGEVEHESEAGSPAKKRARWWSRLGPRSHG